MRAMLCVVAALAACGGSQAAPAPAPEPAEPAPAEVAAVAPEVAVPAPAPADDAKTAWPYTAWDHAEAITFNQFKARRGVPLRVWDDKGWSPHVDKRVAITNEQAAHALALFAATDGAIEVSKCPFPRHAVVFFAGETPVGSIDVCFECGDILAYPETPPSPEEDMDARLTRHEQTLPKWEAFFRDEAKLPMNEWGL